MVAGSLLQGNFEVEYGGIRFGGTDNKEIVSMDLFTSPGLRTNDIPRPQADGMFDGDDYYGPRRFAMEIEVWGASDADLQERIQELLSATSKRQVAEPLVVRLAGWPKDLLLNARPVRRTNILNVESVIGHVAKFTLEWRAADPFIYDNDESYLNLDLSVAAGGGSFDAAFDYSFGGASSTGDGVARNSGNADAYPIVTYTSVANPSLTILSPSGEAKLFKLVGTVQDGETLVIDTRARTILLDGVSVYPWLTDPSAWFVFEPGNTTVTFRGTDPAGAGEPTATVAWRSTTV